MQSRQGQYYEAILSRTVEFKVRRPAYGSRSYQGQESPTRTGRGRGRIHYYAHYQSVFSWLLRMENITFYVFNLNFTDIFRLHSMNLAAFLCFFCFCGWFVEYYLGFTFFWIACFCTFSILSTYTDRNEKRFLFIHYYAHYQRGFLWPLRVKLILLFVFSTCISLTYFVYTASICLLFFVFLSLLLGNVDLWDISWCHMFLYHLCLYFSHIFNLNW